MPLQPGRSPETIGGNIAELVRSYKRKRRIGNTKPKNIKKAQQIAAAIAYRKAREGD